MNLKHLTDDVLLKDTKYLVQRERELTTKVLHHLREIDRRKLYADLRYSSLYEYCLKELHYSEGGAQRRITACRLLGELPQLEKKIESGTLTLTNILEANKFFRDHSVKTPQEKAKILNEVEGLSKRECESKLIAISGGQKKVMTTLFLYHETFKKVERLRNLMGIKNNDELISSLVDSAIQRVEKEKFKINASLPSPVAVKRKIPAGIKGEVYKRDKKCVQCGSIHNLNFDHRIPYSLGGPNSADNIRLLCHNCNQRARIRMRL